MKLPMHSFTFEEYRNLIRLAKQDYTFVGFEKANDTDLFQCAFLRHDIDFSVHRAAKLARIEHEENIRATYFVHLHSNTYHFYEREILDKLSEICSLGHDIALHFDTHFYPDLTLEHFSSRLLAEVQLLESILPARVRAFSFHMPTDEILKCDRDAEVDGRTFVNTYSRWFKDNSFYVSDSNGIWRYNSLHQVLTEVQPQNLQILIHPVWWTEQRFSPKQRLYQAIGGRAKRAKEWYQETSRPFEDDVSVG